MEAHDIAIEKNNGMDSFAEHAARVCTLYTCTRTTSHTLYRTRAGKLVCRPQLGDVSVRTSSVRAKPNPKWHEEFLLYVSKGETHRGRRGMRRKYKGMDVRGENGEKES